MLSRLLNISRWDSDVGYIVQVSDLKYLILTHWSDLELVVRLTSAQVTPLAALTQLTGLCADVGWFHGFDTREFRHALQIQRHERGLPPPILMKFEISSFGI